MSDPRSHNRDDSLSPAEWKQIEQICDRFEQAWNGEAPPQLEEFLEGNWPKPQQVALLRDLLIVELDQRRALGETPTVEEYRERFVGFESAVQQAFPASTEAATLATVPPSADPVQTARQIGPYKLLQQIGEGGMGTVWMAEQEQPVRRRVALKLIKSGVADKQVIARFEAERQALAMMDHHNIAKVLDAGTAADGSPYFVMELVQGIPITEYCDRNKLTPNERLELFIPVCKAVQHAHQKGIIHRDLKPSNVLVCIYDGQPVAKVIDFGLAKALQHQTKLTDKTMFTEFGQVVGTVQYMSPEQAVLDALDVDTRSDIYSLGVLLYELLAGSTPLDEDTLKKHALLKVLEIIRDQDPPRPSHRLSSSGEKAQSISDQRKIPVSKLQQILRGDLDWVIMKALEKDRTRRYETANDFAEDIQRYIDGEVVEARPPSTAYRLSKFVRKNRGLVATVASIILLLIAGVTGTSGGLWWALAEKERADEKTTEAVKERENAETSAINERKARSLAEEQQAIAEQQKSLAEQRTAELAEQRKTLREELHKSNVLRALTLLDAGNVTDAEEVIWRGYFTQPTLNDRRTHWALWKLYRDRPRAGVVPQAGNVLALSESGNLLASALEGRVTIFDTETNQELATFETEHGPVASLAFSADEKHLACGHESYGTITVLDLDDDVDTSAATVLTPQKLDSRMAFLTKMVLRGTGSDVDKATKSIQYLARSEPAVRFLDSTTLLAADGAEIALWDIRKADVTMRGKLGEFSSSLGVGNHRHILGATDGPQILTQHESTLEIWKNKQTDELLEHPIDFNETDFEIGEPQRQPTSGFGRMREMQRGFGGSLVNVVAVSLDWQTLAVQTHDQRLSVWDFQARRRTAISGDNTKFPRFRTMQFVSPKQLVATSGTSVWVIDLPSFDIRNRFELLSRSARHVVSNTETIFALEYGGKIGVYDVAKPSAITSIRDTGGCDALAREGPALVVDEKSLTAWESNRSKTNERTDYVSKGLMSTFAQENKGVAISPTGKAAVVVATNALSGSTLYVYDVRELQLKNRIEMPRKKDQLGFLGIFNNRKEAAAGTSAGEVHLIDLTSQEISKTLSTNLRNLHNATISADDRLLAIRGYGSLESLEEMNKPNGQLTLLDVAAEEQLSTIPAIHFGGQMCFAPDTSALAVAGAVEGPRVVAILKVPELEVVGNLLHNQAVNCLDFSPDGSVLATGSDDGTLRLWDLHTYEELLSLDLEEGAVRLVAFSPDGNTLRYSSNQRVAAIDLTYYDRHIQGNLPHQLQRQLPSMVEQYGYDEALEFVNRLSDIHPEACELGLRQLSELK